MLVLLKDEVYYFKYVVFVCISSLIIFFTVNLIFSWPPQLQFIRASRRRVELRDGNKMVNKLPFFNIDK